MSQRTSDHQQVCICVIGSGYVGLVAALCFAEVGHRVVCVDNDSAKIGLLNQGSVPIFEEHVSDLLRTHLGRGLTFTTDLAAAMSTAEAVFIAVGTPQSDSGAADLSYVEGVVSAIAQHFHGFKVIVEKSTVPVSTSEWVSHCMIRHGVCAQDFAVVSNPEFLREGTAVTDFLHPDRIVVGTDNEEAATLLRRIYEPLTTGRYYALMHSIPGPLTETNPAKLIVTSAPSAELIKHAANAFLAMKISFINAVANLAECVHGDVEEIAAGIGLDSRIGPQFLQAGLGYGGSCFPKDLAAFSSVARQERVNLRILDEVMQINARQQDLFFEKVRKALWTLPGKRVGALGLAFKGGTDDVRDSPAIEVIRRLTAAGCTVRAYDPAAMTKAAAILGSVERLDYATNPYDASEGADALLILTDWQEFRVLDLERLGHLMRFRIIVDGRNLYSPATMRDHGFTYMSIGRPDSDAIPEFRARKDRQLPSTLLNPQPAPPGTLEHPSEAVLQNVLLSRRSEIKRPVQTDLVRTCNNRDRAISTI